jgi:uncharacterized cupredoxin-like copper-binding protein
MPTSKPMRDPANHNFIYQRFQRGVMHYDSTCHCTEGLLLADYLKAVMTGQHLPDDLAAQAASSPLFKQYDEASHSGPLRRTELASTNLSNAFKLSSDSSPNADPPVAAAAPSSAPVAAAPPAATASAKPTTPSPTPSATEPASSSPPPTPEGASKSTAKKDTKSSGSASLSVDENEYSISVNSSTVAAGKLTITLKNSGAIKHELVILATDSVPTALPKAKKDEVDEAKAGETLGEFGALAAGASNTAEFDVPPGHYVMICNITGHYGKGMAAEFTAK